MSGVLPKTFPTEAMWQGACLVLLSHFFLLSLLCCSVLLFLFLSSPSVTFGCLGYVCHMTTAGTLGCHLKYDNQSKSMWSPEYSGVPRVSTAAELSLGGNPEYKQASFFSVPASVGGCQHPKYLTFFL